MNDPNFNFDNKMFDRLSGSFFKHLFEAITEPSAPTGTGGGNKERANNLLVIFALAIIAYAGVEAVKLIFRNNFGKEGVSMRRLVLSVIAFLAISFAAYSMYSSYDESSIEWATKGSFLATAIFYILMSVFVIYNGAIKPKNQMVHESYRGDSSILKFLTSSWKQSTVQNLAEPVLCIALGVFFLPYNFLWGIPLIFCGLSAWLHVLVEGLFKLGVLRDYLSDQMSPRNRAKTFSRASN